MKDYNVTKTKTNSNYRRKRRPLKRNRIAVFVFPVLVLVLLLARTGLFSANENETEPAVSSNVINTVNTPSSEKAVQTDSNQLQNSSNGPKNASVNMPDVNSNSKSEDWNLILVNPWNSLPENYDISLTQLVNGHAVDERCYPDLQQMMDDCRAAGLKPLICSSYRTWEKQEQLFNNKINRLVAEGYSYETAKIEAGKVVAVPGTSEHQLGLAVDIVDVNNQNLDSSQEKTKVQQWLIENSWKYGFILRYPSDKSEITGIIYEPWHYRYVGKDAAAEIYQQGICLEEYLQQLS